MKVRGLILAGVVAGITLWAQQQPPAQPKQPPAQQNPAQRELPVQSDDLARITVDVTNVNLLFTVTDKKGRFVTDLNRGDFEVVENKKPQRVSQFAAETDLPLRLGILIDTSNSIRERFRFEQEAASEFLKTVMRSPQDKGMVMSFDSSAEFVSEMIADPLKLEDAVHKLRPGGGTALYDAIYLACRDRLAKEPGSLSRRAIVVLSDGDDNQSRYTRDQALEMAQKSDVVIYAISTNMSRVDTEGDKVLKYYTSETGGRAFFPFKVEDLEQSFENIANELRHQYIILYRPEPLKTDGLYHPIELRIRNRKDLVVRARPGYYAPRM